MSKLLKSAVSGGTWSFVGALFSSLIGLVFAGMSIRFLGMPLAGFAQAVSSIITLANSVGSLGLGTAALRDLSRLRAEGNTREYDIVLGTCLSVGLMLGAVGSAGLLVGYELVFHWADYKGEMADGRWFLVCAAISWIAGQINGNLIVVVQAAQQWRTLAILNNSSQLLNNLLGLILMTLHPTLLSYGLGMAISSVCMTVIYVMVTTRIERRLILPRFSLQVFRQMWEFGKWIYGTNMVGLLASGWDRLLLVSLFGSSVLPVYTMGRRFYDTMHGLLYNALSFLFPLIAGEGHKAGVIAEGVRDRLQWFAGLVSTWSYLAVILAVPPLLTFLVDAQFSADVFPVLAIFSCIGVFHVLTVVPFLLNYAMGDSRRNFLLNVVSGVLVPPLMYGGAKLAGFYGSVAGQLGILLSVLFYFWLLQPKPRTVAGGWAGVAPAQRPMAATLVLIATGVLLVGWIPWPILHFGIAGVLLVVHPLMILRWERTSEQGRIRVETVARAVTGSSMGRYLPKNLQVCLFGSPAPAV